MSLPRYESYKDSGVEWLGEVPEHWGIVRLRYLCKIETGDADTVDSNEDGSYPFFVRSPNIEKINRYTHDCEAILTAGDGVGVGKVFHYFDGKFCAHQRVYIFRQFEGVQGKFFFHYLKELFLRVVLEGTAKSTVDSLRRPMIADFLMTVPYIEEQSIIADFLDQETAKIDNLIAEQQQLIELLKEKRQAVISHAVTKGLNPDVPMKDSGVEWLGEVPEHWVRTKAKFVSDIFVPQRNKPELNENFGVAWATMEDMKGNYIETVNNFVDSPSAKIAGSKVLKAGAVIASCVGSFDVVSINKINVIINQQLQAFIPHSIKAEYLRELIRISKSYFELVGTATTLVYVNQKGFAELPILLPTTEEQDAIILFLDQETTTIDTLIAESTNLISLSKERRSALISSAVTGKIDVRNYVSTQPQVEAMA